VVAGAGWRALLEADAALARHEEALAVGRTLGGLAHELAAGELCADLVMTGEWERAAEVALEARAARTHARMFADLHRWAQTEALLRVGLDDPPPEPLPGARYRIPILRMGAVRATHRGGPAAALRDLQAAADLAARLAVPGEEWPVRREVARLAEACGRSDLARAERTRAAEVLQGLAVDLPATLNAGLDRMRLELTAERRGGSRP
jgi:hypothetical protein